MRHVGGNKPLNKRNGVIEHALVWCSFYILLLFKLAADLVLLGTCKKSTVALAEFKGFLVSVFENAFFNTF